MDALSNIEIKEKIKRVDAGSIIKEITCGGFPRKHLSVISGTAGSYKTMVSVYSLLESARLGYCVMFCYFDDSFWVKKVKDTITKEKLEKRFFLKKYDPKENFFENLEKDISEFYNKEKRVDIVLIDDFSYLVHFSRENGVSHKEKITINSKVFLKLSEEYNFAPVITLQENVMPESMGTRKVVPEIFSLCFLCLSVKKENSIKQEKKTRFLKRLFNKKINPDIQIIMKKISEVRGSQNVNKNFYVNLNFKKFHLKLV